MREIGKIFSFSAAHQLNSHKGLCRSLHGHNYKLEVRVSGPTSNDQSSSSFGMIMDFGDLKSIVRSVVLNFHDHKYLNDFYHNPTAESMVKSIAEALRDKLPIGVEVTMIKLWETEDSYAIWKES